MSASSERVEVRAPRVAPIDLWKLSANEFNTWRKANDFPRIVAYFQNRLARFREWQTIFGVTDEHLVEFGPGRFLRDITPGFIYIYELENSSGKRSRTIASLKHEIGSVVVGDKILSRHDVQPYLGWAKRERVRPHPLAYNHTLSVALWSQPTNGPAHVSAWLLKELELLFLGGLQLGPQHLIGGRLLEFTCIDHLVIEKGTISNSQLRLWYASARHLTIKENLAFVDGYSTSFNGIQVEGATLQDWALSECLLAGTFRASTLFRWSLVDTTFRPFFDNTDFRECHFRHRAITSVDLTHAIEQYGTIKRALSSRGRYAEAGEYYYLEQCLVRKRLFFATRILCTRLSGETRICWNVGRSRSGEGTRTVFATRSPNSGHQACGLLCSRALTTMVLAPRAEVLGQVYCFDGIVALVGIRGTPGACTSHVHHRHVAVGCGILLLAWICNLERRCRIALL
ncbi:hypothetical protein [Sorangium sp. So ce388]|uniref:hypothetical protein n=1 Tax=Sorangium sp. So ce388 TaxID=3133309 RepID=UPI003F5C39EF